MQPKRTVPPMELEEPTAETIRTLTLPEKCPTCGEDRKNYSTIFLGSNTWRVMYRCGHFFEQEEARIKTIAAVMSALARRRSPEQRKGGRPPGYRKCPRCGKMHQPEEMRKCKT